MSLLPAVRMGIDIVCDNTTHLCLIITGKATTAAPPDVCMKVLHLRSRHYSALISYTLATVVLITTQYATTIKAYWGKKEEMGCS